MVNADPTERLWAMFYFFRRGAVCMRCEVRPDRGSGDYELVIDRPDSLVRTERFREPADLNRRWVDLQRTLVNEGWGGPDAGISADPAVTGRYARRS